MVSDAGSNVLEPLARKLDELHARLDAQGEEIRKLRRRLEERESRWLTYAEAAALIGVSVRHVRRLAAASEVNGMPVSRRTGRPVIHEERLRAWMEER